MSLDQEMKELKQRVATLESGNAPKGDAAVPPVHTASAKQGARVTHPPSEILQDQRLPNNDELAQLLSIVRNDYPSLQPDGSARAMDKDFIAFRLASRWLLDIKRGDLDLMRTLNFWADRAQGFALFHGLKNVLIGGDLLTCAAIASGDIQFLNPDRYPSNLRHVNLKEGYGGRPANSQAWRRILSTGKSPAPSGYEPRGYNSVTIRCAQ